MTSRTCEPQHNSSPQRKSFDAGAEPTDDSDQLAKLSWPDIEFCAGARVAFPRFHFCCELNSGYCQLIVTTILAIH